MSNVVQMEKRHLTRNGTNVIKLPKLENGTTHIWHTGSFCRVTKFWM